MQDYPDFYRLITHSNYNKTVLSFRDDLRLMLMSFEDNKAGL